jgi:molecular chaperone HtpG
MPAVPYRTAHVEGEKRVAEAGIVADMVRQFADKHAFLRELVQNGIDAGATKIEVRLDRDDRGVVRTSVTDDGSGMSRAIIEGPLLTLFVSSKESDSSKIGKYGIGFVSVFALEPDHVDVLTSTGTESWLLRLFGDHTWELSDGGGAPRGSTVTLEQSMSVEEFQTHSIAAASALSKWCRHARVPIELIIIDAGNPTAAQTVAIQEPFAAPGLVSVAWEEGNERIVAACGGPHPSGASFIGYYNRGLTLFEQGASTDEWSGVRVKIDSPKLAHTLSRDGVVRDRELTRLTSIAKELVEGNLCAELYRRIAERAEKSHASADYVPFVEAASVSVFRRHAKKLVVPLLDPIGKQNAMTVKELVSASEGTILVWHSSTRLTHALAKTGRPVVRGVECLPVLRQFVSGVDVEEVNAHIAYAGPAPDRHPNDDELEAALLALLQKVGREARAVQMAVFEGAGQNDAFRVAEGRESVLQHEETPRRRWDENAVVHLNVEDAGVRLARRRAKTELAIAAHLLVRALLLSEGPLPAKLVDRLLEAGLG